MEISTDEIRSALSQGTQELINQDLLICVSSNIPFLQRIHYHINGYSLIQNNNPRRIVSLFKFFFENRSAFQDKIVNAPDGFPFLEGGQSPEERVLQQAGSVYGQGETLFAINILVLMGLCGNYRCMIQASEYLFLYLKLPQNSQISDLQKGDHIKSLIGAAYYIAGVIQNHRRDQTRLWVELYYHFQSFRLQHHALVFNDIPADISEKVKRITDDYFDTLAIQLDFSKTGYKENEIFTIETLVLHLQQDDLATNINPMTYLSKFCMQELYRLRTSKGAAGADLLHLSLANYLASLTSDERSNLFFRLKINNPSITRMLRERELSSVKYYLDVFQMVLCQLVRRDILVSFLTNQPIDIGRLFDEFSRTYLDDDGQNLHIVFTEAIDLLTDDQFNQAACNFSAHRETNVSFTDFCTELKSSFKVCLNDKILKHLESNTGFPDNISHIYNEFENVPPALAQYINEHFDDVKKAEWSIALFNIKEDPSSFLLRLSAAFFPIRTVVINNFIDTIILWLLNRDNERPEQEITLLQQLYLNNNAKLSACFRQCIADKNVTKEEKEQLRDAISGGIFAKRTDQNVVQQNCSSKNRPSR